MGVLIPISLLPVILCKFKPALICPSYASFPYTELFIIKHTPCSTSWLSFKRCTDFTDTPMPLSPPSSSSLCALVPDFRVHTDFQRPVEASVQVLTQLPRQ